MPILLALLLGFARADQSACSSFLGSRAARFVIGAVSLSLVSAGDPRPPVDVQLVLATDISGSIDSNEYVLQKEGIVRAVQDPEVRRAIARCAPRGVALAFTEWGTSYTEVVPFRYVYDARSLADFARAVDAHHRLSETELTDLENGLRQSHRMLLDSDWSAGRRLIDVSSDGIQNYPRHEPEMAGATYRHERVAMLRDEIVADDVTINALVLNKNKYAESAPEKTVDEYYQKYVIGGRDAFTEQTRVFADVRLALQKKLAREICAGANY